MNRSGRSALFTKGHNRLSPASYASHLPRDKSYRFCSERSPEVEVASSTGASVLHEIRRPNFWLDLQHAVRRQLAPTH